jgi:hypothetical protein
MAKLYVAISRQNFMSGNKLLLSRFANDGLFQSCGSAGAELRPPLWNFIHFQKPDGPAFVSRHLPMVG